MARSLSRAAAVLTLAAWALAQPAGETCSPATWYLAHGDPARALRALSALPGGTDENLRGVARLVAGDAAGALEAFEEALAADPQAARVRLNRAIALIRLDRLGEAASDLETIAADENASALHATAAYHRALVAHRAGQLETASSWLDRALRADPDSADALLYAGVVLERRGLFDSAGKRYRAYLDRHPGSIVAMLRFGIVAHRAGHRDLAKKYLDEVVRRAPESREALEARKFLILWE
jgi:predicted Zn-dependent protease